MHQRHSALSLFRVAQEALSNAVKHGDPTRISVRLHRDDGGVRLEIEDDGCGITQQPRKGPGIGLTSMRERMASVGGTLEVHTEVGEGTIVIATARS